MWKLQTYDAIISFENLTDTEQDKLDHYADKNNNSLNRKSKNIFQLINIAQTSDPLDERLARQCIDVRLQKNDLSSVLSKISDINYKSSVILSTDASLVA